MHENNSPLEHLELVYEMNRLFLSFLQGRACRGVECLGLATPVCALLRTATDAQLDRAAGLPRGLFRIDCDLDTRAARALERDSSELIALYSLQSKLLLSARHLCSQNAHLAQAFLGLPDRTLVRLSCLALLELATLAETACLVAASFEDEPWLWRELLCSENPMDLRRARLIALQPRAADMNAVAEPGLRRLR